MDWYGHESAPAGCHDALWIGDWRVDPPGNRISLGGNTVRLEPRAMATLLYLAGRPEEVATRREIEAIVWPGMVIGNDALNNTIAKLRKALGDDPRNPRFIETVPKVGYRLIAGVEPSPSSEADGAPLIDAAARSKPEVLSRADRGTPERRTTRRRAATLAAMAFAVAGGLAAWLQPWSSPPDVETDLAAYTSLPPPARPSIAVLPFENLGGKPEHEYFSDGLTADLITNLSRIGRLLVVSRDSTFAYKGRSVPYRQIASDLGVQYILEGSIRRQGDKVRINAQLIDTATDSYLWARRYDGNLEDVFALQDRLTDRITHALSVTLTPDEQSLLDERQTASAAAYEAFLLGWEHFRRQTFDDFVAARRYLEQAITIDPDYSRAYGALAAVYWEAKQREWYPAVRADYIQIKKRALEYLDKAKRKPTAIAFAVTARIHVAHGEFPAAITAARRAIELAPSDASAHLTLAETLIYAGQPEEALAHITQAMRLDPLHESYPYYLRGLAAFGLERFDAAATFLSKALDLNPNYLRPAAVLAAARGLLGRKDEAFDALRLYASEYEKYGVPSTVLAFPYQNEVDRTRLAEGLRRAGMPELDFRALPSQSGG